MGPSQELQETHPIGSTDHRHVDRSAVMTDRGNGEEEEEEEDEEEEEEEEVTDRKLNQMFAKSPKNIREEEKEENGRSTTAVLSSGSERSMQTFSLTPPELSDLLFLSGADILNHQRT